jgi:predicted RNA-binding Zn-ribbon protein involved in translation (DUF1610 family)
MVAVVRGVMTMAEAEPKATQPKVKVLRRTSAVANRGMAAGSDWCRGERTRKMARLETCPDCGAQISSRAWACPQCGNNRFRVAQRRVAYVVVPLVVAAVAWLTWIRLRGH